MSNTRWSMKVVDLPRLINVLSDFSDLGFFFLGAIYRDNLYHVMISVEDSQRHLMIRWLNKHKLQPLQLVD